LQELSNRIQLGFTQVIGQIFAQIAAQLRRRPAEPRAELGGDLVEPAQPLGLARRQEAGQLRVASLPAHRPDGEDEGAAGVLAPQVGQVVNLDPGRRIRQSLVADDQRRLAPAERRGTHLTDLHGRHRRQPPLQQDVQQRHRRAGVGAKPDPLDLPQWRSAGQHDAAHRPRRGDGDARQDDQVRDAHALHHRQQAAVRFAPPHGVGAASRLLEADAQPGRKRPVAQPVDERRRIEERHG